MKNNFLNKIFSWFKKKSKHHTFKANIIPRKEHNVSRNILSKNAVKVLYRLKNNGYEAYLVGGCIRDILLGIEPKDFDVATDATPEKVRSLFSNCRLIGRRFPLAHVYFKHEVIEVATFRSEHKSSDHTGMITKDHVYGMDLAEDANRRDFTVNAIFYSIKDFSLVDYVSGLDDIKNRQLKLIGEPITRYKEDPVRMLRAVRFASKLDFEIHPDTYNPILELKGLLSNIPSARIFEEYIKLFLKGDSVKNFILLRKTELFGILFPLTEKAIKDSEGGTALKFIELALQNTDERVASGKTISPAFLFAVLLWDAVSIKAKELLPEFKSEFSALFAAMDIVLESQRDSVAIPKKISGLIKDVWSMQLNLNRQFGKRAAKLFASNKFRASYDFLLLRAKANDQEAAKLADWWSSYIKANEQDRWQMALSVEKFNKNKGRYKRKPKKKSKELDA